jgi:hypothetical protein
MTIDDLDLTLFNIEQYIDAGGNPRGLFMRFRDELEMLHYSLIRGCGPQTHQRYIYNLQNMQRCIQNSIYGTVGQKLSCFRESLSYAKLALQYAQQVEEKEKSIGIAHMR